MTRTEAIKEANKTKQDALITGVKTNPRSYVVVTTGPISHVRDMFDLFFDPTDLASDVFINRA